MNRDHLCPHCNGEIMNTWIDVHDEIEVIQCEHCGAFGLSVGSMDDEIWITQGSIA